MPPESPREFFSHHAHDYALSKSHAKGEDLERLVSLLSPKESERALDVGTGTGFTAMALAPLVSEVVGVDITDEMLDEARRLTGERGITNVRYEKADASRLPYPSGSFDIVATRRAAHHFADVRAFVAEAARVLRKGGRLGIDDMSPPEVAQDFANRLEVLRDGTHARAYSMAEWVRLVESTGLTVEASEALEEYIPFGDWLYPVRLGGPEEVSIMKAASEAPKEAHILLGMRFEGGRFAGWSKTRAVIVAKKT